MTESSSVAVSFEGKTIRSRIASFVFGDRVGLAVFLAALCLFTVLWITAWRINDSITLMNTLNGMSEGHLHITEVKHGEIANMPGSHRVGEQIFGRNYGVLSVSLVPLVLLETLAEVVDLRILLSAAFSVTICALGIVVGRILQRERLVVWISATVAFVLFVGNVALATNLDPPGLELLALQITHILAGGFVLVATYRLTCLLAARRTGFFAAACVALGTPLGLWASIPKRHVLTGLLILGLAGTLYRSLRPAEMRPRSTLYYRSIGYGSIVLFAWVHAPEALVLMIVYATFDLLTADNDLRSLLSIGVVTVMATVPFLITNYLISGSPVKPPRLVPRYGGATGEPTIGGDNATTGGSGIFEPFLETFDPVLSPLIALVSLFIQSLQNLIFEPGEIWSIFVRSGYLEEYAHLASFESVNLSVLESTPILAAMLGVVPLGMCLVSRKGEINWSATRRPERVVDAYLVVISIVFALLYISRLPVQAQITVRYMLPIVPPLIILIVRLPAIRGVLDGHWKLMLWTYAGAVLIGGQLVIVAIALIDPAIGEAFQFHGLLSLAIATPLAVWSLAGRHDGWWGRVGAVLIALATAAITVFLLMLTLDYFTIGNSQALPLVRAVADVVSIT